MIRDLILNPDLGHIELLLAEILHRTFFLVLQEISSSFLVLFSPFTTTIRLNRTAKNCMSTSSKLVHHT
jgi:hypothetical protein